MEEIIKSHCYALSSASTARLYAVKQELRPFVRVFKQQALQFSSD